MPYQPEIILDGQPVEKITAFLFPKGGHENPKTLLANAEKSFQGSIVLGMGFTFDDTAPEATSLAEMQRLITENPKNQERIFPYIGGSEVNTSPTHVHHRYTINFENMSEEESRKWPDLIKIVEEKVKPTRLKDNREIYRRYWWQFCEKRIVLYQASKKHERVLAIACRASKHFGIVFLPTERVYDQSLVVFSFDTYSAFGFLQTRVHEIWVRFLGSSMEDRIRYSPTDCFQTFPFPETWETDPTLESIGQEYYTYRAALMLRNNQGLTDTYNRFHAPEETDPEILHLRHLHDQMDRAVLNAYSWPDISIACGFALDYLDIDPANLPTTVQDRIASGDLFFPTAAEASSFDNLVRSTPSTRKKKLPWRCRWPEAIHDEVLARLLDLNQQRYEAEVTAGLHGKKKTTKRKTQPSQTKPKSNPKQPSAQLDLLN